MYLQSTGKDGALVWFASASFTVKNTYGVNYANSTNNRHALPGSIKGGTITVYNNIIIGGNNAVVGTANSNVYQNLLRQSGFVTNGYSAHYYRVNGCSTYYNLMIPTNGRGIMHNAGENHVSYGNVICVLEEPNSEFGSGLNPPAIRMRYDADNNKFYNNTCLGIAGITGYSQVDTLTSTSPVYLSNNTGMKNYIYNNRLWAIHTGGTAINRYANAITFEGHGATSDSLAQDSIYNNDFRSNQWIVRVAGWDGACYQNQIINNSFNWISGDSAYSWFADSVDNFNHIRPNLSNNDYATQAVYDSIVAAFKTDLDSMIVGVSDNVGSRNTFHTNYYINNGYITVLDSDLGDGVSMSNTSDVTPSSDNTGGILELRIGHSLWVNAKDSLNNNIVSETITVSDSTGTTFTGTTNASGIARLELIDHQFDKANGNNTVTKAARTSHQANIDGYDSVELSLEDEGTEGSPKVLNFGGSGGNGNGGSTSTGLMRGGGAGIGTHGSGTIK